MTNHHYEKTPYSRKRVIAILDRDENSSFQLAYRYMKWQSQQQHESQESQQEEQQSIDAVNPEIDQNLPEVESSNETVSSESVSADDPVGIQSDELSQSDERSHSDDRSQSDDPSNSRLSQGSVEIIENNPRFDFRPSTIQQRSRKPKIDFPTADYLRYLEYKEENDESNLSITPRIGKIIIRFEGKTLNALFYHFPIL